MNLVNQLILQNDIENTSHELLNWCTKTKKTIDQINRYSDDLEEVRMYNIFLFLQSVEEFISHIIVKNLEEQNMSWRTKTNLKTTERINDELIPWSIALNRSIDELNYAYKSLYVFTKSLRHEHIKPKLDISTINLLNEHGMFWGSKYHSNRAHLKYKSINRIYNELIPYCEANHTKIKYINYETNRSLYTFILNLRKIKDDLPTSTIKLLDKHGMNWETYKSTDERIIDIVNWCKSNNKPISRLTRKDDPQLYDWVKDIKHRHKKYKILTQSQIDILTKCGLILYKKRMYTPDEYAQRIISWCEENNKTILDIPFIDVNGNINKLSKILYSLKLNKEKLSAVSLNRLLDFGANFNRIVTPTLDVCISEEFIPYLDSNQIYVTEIPEFDADGKPNKYYKFAKKLTTKKEQILKKNVKILEELDMRFIKSTRTHRPYMNITESINLIVKACRKYNTTVSHLAKYGCHSEYASARKLQYKLDKLTEEERTLLEEECGLKLKNKISETITID